MASVFKRGGKKAKGYWYASWFDHKGKRRTKCTRTTDKATAERIARKHEADAALRRESVIDPTIESIRRQSDRTVKAHLVDYENKLRALKRSDEYIRETMKIIDTVCEAGRATTIGKINADLVNRHASNLADAGRSARTIQKHVGTIKSFTKWLAENQKLQRDPLAAVKKPSPKGHRRQERRILLPEEWKWIKATITGDSYGMTATERLLLYRLALQTGLRSSELRSLTRGKIVSGKEPHVLCKARDTKNKKSARQFIDSELAADLLGHVERKSPTANVFRMPHKTDVADMFRRDLLNAREAWVHAVQDDPQEFAQRQESDFLAATNHEGQITDFHCLRHSCGAWLAVAGVHPKVVQTVMRHSTISLTMDTYGHLFPGQEADAANKLSQIITDVPTLLEATGTDGSQPKKQRSARRSTGHAIRNETVRLGAPCGEDEKTKEARGKPTILGLSSSEAEGTRTPNHRIDSPVL